ncbi:MAG: M28 family metallopeptidase [Promethearchaeota archaeon]
MLADVLTSFFLTKFELFKGILIFIFFYFVFYFIDLNSNLYRINYKFGKEKAIKSRHISQNILTTVKAKHNFKERPVIIFSAHYDSASVNYNEKFLIYIYISYFFFSSTYFSIIYIFDFYFPVKLIIFFFGLIYLIFFLTIKINNRSNGSIDNASGTAILIELSRLFYNNPLTNLDIIFLWTGAEELGLWGSRNYCTKNLKWLNKKYNLNKSYIINIDMVGSYIGLVNNAKYSKKKLKNINLTDLIKDIAKEKGISLKIEKKFITLLSDNIIFNNFAKKIRKKLQICTFNSANDKKFIHSTKDTPDKCFSENLNGCIDICYFTLKKLDTYQ